MLNKGYLGSLFLWLNIMMKNKTLVIKSHAIATVSLITLFGCGGGSSNSETKVEPVTTTTPATETRSAPTIYDIPQVSSHWQLVWSDEFSGSEVDTAKWSFEQNCAGGGNNEQQCYTNRLDNAFLEEGKLIIKAIREDFTGPASFDDSPDYDPNITRTLPYTSARLRSKEKGDWRYGRFEIRAKLPAGQGTWPAIWMLPTQWAYGGWAGSGEIDIMEAVNLKARSDENGTLSNFEENRVHGTLHYGRAWPENVYTGTSYVLPENANPADDFHVYTIEWQRGEIRWYVDGAHYATQTQAGWYTQYHNQEGQLVNGEAAAPFDQTFHLLLNFAVGGDWPGNVNEQGIDESVFPQRLEIDYVRVYQCSLNVETGEGCEARGSNAKVLEGHQAPPL